MSDVIKSNLNTYKYRDSNGNILCDIIVIYSKSDAYRGKYTISLELRKYVDTPFEFNQEFRQPISVQDIASRESTIGYDVDRLIDRMIETRYLDKYLNELDNGISMTIERMRDIA